VVEDTVSAFAGVSLQRDAAQQSSEFVRGRLRALWSEEYPGDLVEAVLAAGWDDVVDARERLAALAEVRARPDFIPLAVAFKRVANIQEKGGAGGAPPDLVLFRESAESELHATIVELKARVGAEKRARDYVAALRTIAEIKPAVDAFFDKVLVMAEDEAVRRNRLALMREVSALFADVADFRKIQAELPQQPRA
jgi:glycyl-tRNA synthetase beta chain